MKIVVVGGGAGGASFAARMRRLDDKCEIIILEKTNETSIASCGLPYFIGGVIEDRDNMQVATPQFLKQLFNIDIKLNTEVVKINPQEKNVVTALGEVYPYDKLVLAMGAKPFVPEIKGLEKIPHFVVKNLADADKIKNFVEVNKPQKAVVVGGGFIGVEVAENLCHLEIKTSLVELSSQVLMPMDGDMVKLVQKEMKQNGLNLYLNEGLKEVEKGKIKLNSSKEIDADMMVLAIGVRPETGLLEMPE